MTGVNERHLKFVLVLAIAASPLSLQIYLPAIPSAQAEFGATAAEIQLTFSLAVFSFALAPLVYGPLSDRYGRRRVLFYGFVIYAIGSVLCALAPSTSVLTAARILQALGSAAGMVITRAVVGDVYTRDKAAAVLASLIVAMIVAPMIAPILGGVLTQFFGWRSVFWVSTGIAIVMAVLVRAYLPETLKQSVPFQGVGGMLRSFRALLREPLYLAFVLQGAFMISSFYIFLASAPYVVVDVLGRPEAEFGLYFLITTVGFMAGNILAGRYSERVGVERMVVYGCLLSFAATSFSLGLSLAGLWTPLALFGPIMIMGCANGLCLPNGSAGAVAVNPTLAGAASGLMTFIQMSAAAGFSQTVGSIQNATPFPMTGGMAMTSLAALLSYFVLLKVARSRKIRP